MQNLKGLGEGSFFGFIGLKRKEAHTGTVKEKREKLNVRMIIIVIGRLKLLLYLEFKKKMFSSMRFPMEVLRQLHFHSPQCILTINPSSLRLHYVSCKSCFLQPRRPGLTQLSRGTVFLSTMPLFSGPQRPRATRI